MKGGRIRAPGAGREVELTPGAFFGCVTPDPG
jgi:hypothetical protein